MLFNSLVEGAKKGHVRLVALRARRGGGHTERAESERFATISSDCLMRKGEVRRVQVVVGHKGPQCVLILEQSSSLYSASCPSG
jgi:hypothetical protein